MSSSNRIIGVTRWLVSVACSLVVSGHASSETIDVNGFEMYYEIIGDGEPLVLLHGFNSTGHAAWGSMVGDFSKEFQLIIPDLRGHGSSTNPSGEFTHRQSAQDIFALLDGLGLDRIKAIGGSTGGMTLLHMATEQPDRIEAMVLRGTTIYFPEQAREILRATNADTVSEERMRKLRERHKHGEEQIAALLRQFNGFKDSYDDMNFTRPYLSTIKARTLIVHGDRDQFFPAHIALEMYEGIPNSALWVVPNAGHRAAVERDQGQFIRTVTAFLKDEL